jgi:hypothetical protein
MSMQRDLLHHGALASAWLCSANCREGGRQDKSRKVLGGRTDQNAKENSLQIQGAWAATTLLHATTRWKQYGPNNLEVAAQ